MKSIIKMAVICVFWLTVGICTVCAEVGWLSSYAYIWRGEGDDVWYDLNAMDHAENFHGADLGVFDPDGEGLFSALYLNSQLNAWADGDDYYIDGSFRLYYRVYSAGEESPTTWEDFSQSVSITHTGGNNWQAHPPGVNLIEGLAPDDYKVDIFAYKIHYWDTGDGGEWEERIWWDGGDGQPFTAEFGVVPEPGAFALIGLGLFVLLCVRQPSSLRSGHI